MFGVLRESVVLSVKGGGVDWRPNLAFPGLRPGEALHRRIVAVTRSRAAARPVVQAVLNAIDAGRHD